ncbi:LCP family glycopolymer transferase [Salinibacillus xinjiangensis]|uniref:Transcriptional regulator LytR n=1 Tax=Salinibacillus xinjiangensis TaxID=1229268 RepID=A0A6G1X1U3_9BACI|nr:LCP family protein [Salinibacillus xinjiangensis]MRG84798.1 transcriptional regulator LytR [Salinibacillus xinjiangensis]
MGKRTERVKSKKKRLKKILLVLLIIGLGIGAYVFSIYHDVKQTVEDELHETITNIEYNPKKVQSGKETLNILLMGVDERENDIGRADTLIMLSLNPSTESMQMISIPRDTYTDIIGYGKKDKINHSYPFGVLETGTTKGGTDMTVATVENFLDVELDYYVRMNMEGLTELVDAIDGITVDNPIEFTQNGDQFPKGEVHLDGPRAMNYVRMRKQDPEGDMGRNLRQRLVIQGIIEKGASVGSVTRIDDILDVLGQNMTTNMTFDEMKDIFKNYRSARHNQNNYQITGKGQYIGDIWYLMVADEEIQKVHQMIDDFSSKQ